MLWNRRRWFVLSPAGLVGTELVFAAGSAGGLGLLDVTCCLDVGAIRAKLADFGLDQAVEFGIRARPTQLCGDWLGELSRWLRVVVCAGPWAPAELELAWSRLRGCGIVTIAEVISLEEAEQARELGVDGLIVVGREAGGRAGGSSTFALLQEVLPLSDRPVWARGGTGGGAAVGMVAAGAEGVVVEEAVLLASESPLPSEVRAAILAGDRVPVVIPRPDGSVLGVVAPPRSAGLDRLWEMAGAGAEEWEAAVAELVGWGLEQAWPAGPDILRAGPLAREHGSAAAILRALDRSLGEHFRASGSVNRFGGTRLPATSPPVHGSRHESATAVIGIAAVLPGASDLESFWFNSVQGFDAITEVPPECWDWRLYYDPDPKAPDKIYSKWGGFVPEIPFDPLRYGMPPSSLPSIEPAQLLALETARRALADAGYEDRPFPRERTAVVLGMGGGAAQLAMGYAFRSYLPMLNALVPGGGDGALRQCAGLIPEWTEDSFPGFLLNVTAGRIANRLDLGGANYTVDAACGSSLAALNLAVRELTTGAADVVILGGVDTVQNPFTYLAFSKTQAFSPRGRCRPFDASADGIVISEGVVVVVLKRLRDAERDGDRIYAVVRGVGSSSDGRCRGLTAPSLDGQVRALQRAYLEAGVDPATVGYLEAHGTGTAVGDVVELEALGRVFRTGGPKPGACVVGSIKSQIGHTKCAAGLAGLVHASLALYHQVLPPTIGIESPNPQLDLETGPFRLNTEARPWLKAGGAHPRRAGVSAFGFGGTNFHAVLEAYQGNSAAPLQPVLRKWPAELLVWQGLARTELLNTIARLVKSLNEGLPVPLHELAHAVNCKSEPQRAGPVLALVAASHDDLAAKLNLAVSRLQEGAVELADRRGLYYAESPPLRDAPIAFIFPGQGTQSVGMLRELAVTFPQVRSGFEEFDAALGSLGCEPVSPWIFPPPAFHETDRHRQQQRLSATEIAQPALGAACLGLARLLSELGLKPDLLAGHSYGELVALHLSGALEIPGLAALSQGRGRLLRDAAGDRAGAMAALFATAEQVLELLRDHPDVQPVNLNGPRQTVVAGPAESVAGVVEWAKTRGISGRLLPVSCAFHTSMMEPAREPLALLARQWLTKPPQQPVYSNLDALPHPADPAAIANRLGDHAVHPVRFAEMILAMHSAGARVFLEVGPAGYLTPLVESILEAKDYLAVACEPAGRPGLTGFLHSLAQLAVAGVSARYGWLTTHRAQSELDLTELLKTPRKSLLPPSTWMVNGSRARPVNAPEPRRLGQAIHPRLTTGGDAISPTFPVAAEPDPQGTPPLGPLSSNGHLAMPLPTLSTAPLPTLSTAPPPPPATATSRISERVLASFHETMQKFLEVQRETMLCYLSGQTTALEAPAPLPDPPVPVNRRTERAERATSPPSESPAITAPPPVATDSPTPARAKTHRGDGGGASREEIAETLLEIVRERTGYPREVLGLELDLEADLGIDSIKRVEILGKLREAFPKVNTASGSEKSDRLTRETTLGAIVERVVKLLAQADSNRNEPAAPVGSAISTPGATAAESSPAATTPPASPRVETVGNGRHHEPPRRLMPEIVEEPLRNQETVLSPGGMLILTDDGRGIAGELATRLNAAGFHARLMNQENAGIDWGSPSSIAAALGRWRRERPITGLVHLLPLRAVDGLLGDMASWTNRIDEEARGLFILAKEAAGDLEQAAARGGSCLIAATAMGGSFASGPQSAPTREFFPGHGAIAGLVKTLAREWPEVRTKVVDVDPETPQPRLAEWLFTEILTDDGWAEVGYVGERRIRLRSVAAPYRGRRGTFFLKPGDGVVITGGARGITSLVAAELARRYRASLLLLGTTPYPGPDDPDLELVTTGDGVKSVLYHRLARQHQTVSPALLERDFQAVRRRREIRRTLDRIQDLGSIVEYAQVDVRDPVRLEEVLRDWRSRHGEPVGLIHGAGLIQDKLIEDKSLASFDRVVGTKLNGALNLVQLLRPEVLRFTVFFSSIAGRFGNRGQSDYAAANELLNKLALWLNPRWPGRVVALNWGPWSGIGMVSELEHHLGQRGLGMIAPEAGVAALVDELEQGVKGEVEVILSGELGELEAAPRRRSRSQDSRL